MSSEGPSIISNVYASNLTFDREVDGFHLFSVTGISSNHERFKQLGVGVTALRRKYRRSFASYTPSRDSNYLVGWIPLEPSEEGFEVDGLKITYEGKRPLPPTGAGARTLTELLNKSKATELRNILWSPGSHAFYPKRGRNLDQVGQYQGCGLTVFRGPFFRYNVLANGKIVLVLDSSTHYIRSEPFLKEIRRRGGILDWFVKEIEEKREEIESQGRRHFTGIHFYYELHGSDVAIDGVDPRPISEIHLPKPALVNGVECKTIAEYLRNKYRGNPIMAYFDHTQPGLKNGVITYPPQFLYRTVPNNQVPNKILNDVTFLMDRAPRRYRDIHRPAKLRWDFIKKYFFQYNFQYVDLGPLQLKVEGPLIFPLSNRFEKPRLLTSFKEPIPANELESKLADGVYIRPNIDQVYLYSSAQAELARELYASMVRYAKRKYGVALPDSPIPLEPDLAHMRTQLEKSIAARGGPSSCFCVAVIPENSGVHDDVTNICGELNVPSKCVTIPVAEAVVLEGNETYLRDTFASIIVRGGGIPWILYDKLHYGCYISVDVGRTKSEYWALSVVYGRDGKFTTKQGGPIIGEDLEEQSISYCVREASRYAPDSDSLVYLRDGDVFETERRMFESVVEPTKYETIAMVSIKEMVPHRIFRHVENNFLKPLSGDYYFLDDYNAVLCAAGADEYEHGMPQPIVAEVIPIRGTINPRDLVADAFKLCYLNWESPGRSYSAPAPTRLAHKLATELSRGVRRFGLP